MGYLCGVLASVAVLVGSASAFAQSADPPPPLPARAIALATIPAAAPDVFDPAAATRDAELQQWIADFSAWQEWSDRWISRRQPGWFTAYRKRRAKPAPPDWLQADCATGVIDEDPLVPACMLVAQWSEDRLTTEARAARAASVTQQEAPANTVWWNHVHLDMLWPATQLRSSVYGVIGTHVAVTVQGRLQVFIAPGAMFMNLPTRNGGRVWKLATSYGVGYRLFDFHLAGRQATMHLNIAKAWLLSDQADLVGTRSTDFAGFSLTFAKPQ
jgi:hypothetical protein